MIAESAECSLSSAAEEECLCLVSGRVQYAGAGEVVVECHEADAAECSMVIDEAGYCYAMYSEVSQAEGTR